MNSNKRNSSELNKPFRTMKMLRGYPSCSCSSSNSSRQTRLSKQVILQHHHNHNSNLNSNRIPSSNSHSSLSRTTPNLHSSNNLLLSLSRHLSNSHKHKPNSSRTLWLLHLTHLVLVIKNHSRTINPKHNSQIIPNKTLKMVIIMQDLLWPSLLRKLLKGCHKSRVYSGPISCLFQSMLPILSMSKASLWTPLNVKSLISSVLLVVSNLCVSYLVRRSQMKK
mmetsp:Transcript_31800/g.43041  ORF Transcript_31800/g.43041 Transcript_31800/m.43041 type:complete len:222 (+) Transcript_31800:123-788(+)